MKYIIKKMVYNSKLRIDYIKELNAEQYEVVTTAEGPCLVLAGAGSGKTRTLIYRVAYLLEKGIPPQNILLVTFTNKAAREMQDRIEMLLKSKPKGLWNGTFHHIGNKSLRYYAKELGYKRNFGILDEEDSIDLLKVCIKNIRLRMDYEQLPHPSVIKTVISLSINSNASLGAILERFYPYLLEFHDIIYRIGKEYESKKISSNVMDYNDLLSRWLWLLKNIPPAKLRFSKQFQYILVDEYQDTNRLQAEIIKELSSFHKNVLVVGDDAQSIYSFRGADISNILRFPEEYPNTRIFKLETNYRSTPEILDLANNSISHNENQFCKKLRSIKENYIKPVIAEVRDLHAQAEFVSQRILELEDEGIPPHEIAILFRAHYQAAEFEMELTKRNIPYVIRGGVRFFEQAHIKDVLAHIKILLNPSDEVSWIRTLSIQPGIGTVYAGRIFDEFIKTGSLKKVLDKRFGNFLPHKSRNGLNNFKKILKPLISRQEVLEPDVAIKSIIENGYEKYVMTHFDNAKDRIDDLHELINFAHGYKNLASFIQDITMRESFKGETINQTHAKQEYLILSTIHQAKGLEWKIVFIIGLCEGQFPHPKSKNDLIQLEEERRLFYVAITRAKKELYLIHPITRYDYQMGTVISRKSLFLEELNRNLYDEWEIEKEYTYKNEGDYFGEDMINLENI